MKVEWTLLTAAVCRSRCGEWTVSHVHSYSAPDGAQVVIYCPMAA
jgi:hypothetical protein